MIQKLSRVMRKLAWLLVMAPLIAREPLKDRIGHNDPSNYRKAPAVHKGAGELHFFNLLDPLNLTTNLIFLHRGVIPPKGGIGHHYHNQMEEMFVIFDNEAQFTIDGRTSQLKGPVGAPCRMGRSHAIYNPTDKPTQWMNIAVGSAKLKYDNFDLDDDRVDAQLDRKPVFITMKLDRTMQKPVDKLNGGNGTAMYRRALGPEVFFTNWSYMDHVVLPPGASVGMHRHTGVEEIYYVMDGEGVARVNKESAGIKKGDAVPVALNESHEFENTGSSVLEFMVIGIAREKGRLD